MTDYRAEILDASDKIIQRLNDLIIFFEDQTIMKIYLQSQVIHKLFEENPDIDINKLELYHIQFTSTLIDLLDKIKRKNERIVNKMESEIELNSDMIAKLKQAITQEGGFEAEKLQQAQRITRSIYNLHKALSSQSSEYPYTDNINAFSLKYYKDYFFDADPQLLTLLTTYNHTDAYRNTFGAIDKKLLSDLVKVSYKVQFCFGIRINNTLMEIYKIGNDENYFSFQPTKNNFLPCDINVFPYKEWESESSKKERSVKELIQKNIDLEKDIKFNLRHIDSDIVLLLDENLRRITELDFLADLENIDIQANTLRTMIETKMI